MAVVGVLHKEGFFHILFHVFFVATISEPAIKLYLSNIIVIFGWGKTQEWLGENVQGGE